MKTDTHFIDKNDVFGIPKDHEIDLDDLKLNAKARFVGGPYAGKIRKIYAPSSHIYAIHSGNSGRVTFYRLKADVYGELPVYYAVGQRSRS